MPYPKAARSPPAATCSPPSLCTSSGRCSKGQADAMGNSARTSGAEAALLPHRGFTADGGTYLYAAETGGLFRMGDGVGDALSALASSGAGSVPQEVLSDLRRAGLFGTAGECGPAVRTAHPPLRLRTLVLMLT